jgi:antitoxin component YwqK of YwqJK toxin-antitoxin module
MKKLHRSIIAIALGGLTFILWKPVARRVRMVNGIFHIVREDISKERKGLLQFKPGEMVEYYLGGHLKVQAITKGSARGTRTSWYEDGQKQEEVICNDGQIIVTRTWTHEGKAETSYNNGHAEILKEWFLDGQLSSETSYDGTGQTVLLKQWHPNGQLRMILEFKDGTPHKLLKYDTQGQKIEESLYINGKPVRQI